MFQLVNFVIYWAVWILMFSMIFGSAGNQSGGFSSVAFVLVAALGVYMLAIIVPLLAVSVRRLHDTGRSGWWLLLSFVPFVGGLVVFVFTVLDSQPGENMYGPNPKGVVSSGVPVTLVQ